ncbi:MAG: type VII toxin-antitoxin system MntA family adenylyltransferase antitoxin [Chloroflexia bacterium]
MEERLPVDWAAYLDDTPVLVAYLFGSRARGEPHPRSDIDIAVLLQEGLPSLEKQRWRLALIARLSRVLRTDDVDVVVLNEASPMLRYEAIRPRRVLFCRDEEARVAFEFRTMQEWFDWQPRFDRLQTAWCRYVLQKAVGGDSV